MHNYCSKNTILLYHKTKANKRSWTTFFESVTRDPLGQAELRLPEAPSPPLPFPSLSLKKKP